MDTALQELAMNGLKQVFKHLNPALALEDTGDMVVCGQRIDIVPVVERSGHQQGTWFYGVRFELCLDGENARQFTTGSIGLGDSQEEARNVAVEEWLALFGYAFARAMVKSDESITIERFVVYPGLMGTRGRSPEGWVDGTDSMHKTILSALRPVLSEPGDGSPLISLNLMLTMQADGTMTGECRRNGAVSARTLSLLAQLPWPKTPSYMFKQHYIVMDTAPKSHDVGGVVPTTVPPDVPTLIDRLTPSARSSSMPPADHDIEKQKELMRLFGPAHYVVYAHSQCAEALLQRIASKGHVIDPEQTQEFAPHEILGHRDIVLDQGVPRYRGVTHCDQCGAQFQEGDGTYVSYCVLEPDGLRLWQQIKSEDRGKSETP